MAENHSREATNALFAAGIIAIAIGLVLATFSNGLVLGLVIALVGVVLSAVFATRAWRQWWSRPKSSAPEHLDPDRFWNAEERLKSLVGSGVGVSVVTIVYAILNPTRDEWWRLWVIGPLLVSSIVAFLLVRRHNRTKLTSTPEVPEAVDYARDDDTQDDPAGPRRA